MAATAQAALRLDLNTQAVTGTAFFVTAAMRTAKSTRGMRLPASQSHQAAWDTPTRAAASFCSMPRLSRHLRMSAGAPVFELVSAMPLAIAIAIAVRNSEVTAPAIGRGPRLFPMGNKGTKALDPHVTERLRAIVREIVNKDFAGSQKDAAKAIGVAQPTISDILAEKRGVGVNVLTKLARYTQRSTDDLMGQGTRATAVHGPNVLEIERALRDAEEAIARAKRALRVTPRLRKVQ